MPYPLGHGGDIPQAFVPVVTYFKNWLNSNQLET